MFLVDFFIVVFFCEFSFCFGVLTSRACWLLLVFGFCFFTWTCHGEGLFGFECQRIPFSFLALFSPSLLPASKQWL